LRALRYETPVVLGRGRCDTEGQRKLRQ